ncbi:hypothetical protein O163_13930 [Caldanaerobacter subterraneus subsp. yonseiensis KB-1]|uniref:Tetrapyrrole methylase domain-containing protein n=1 Tax=Caldanaerobacter subterraneus subsp. yonseiensis KB-1 TaxID=1388761 RepID=U5CCX9_CALSX|nr:precorrin-6y C5,15-methyltransferase (decarboxylating) subunit CbiE [Caldanaerobacter subterraneus]ERM90785.1 hypothetical protein O163_13930 [Caldanaerobacter subterraneus subsp. yonseiensis KB-1]
MVTIVGVGPGSRKFMPLYALEKIQNAKVLVGGRRHLEEFKDVPCKKIVIDASLDFKELLQSDEEIVILASGDPLLYGIAETVLKYVDKEKVEIISGISSVQYMCAKIKISMRDLPVLSLHGREEDFIEKLRQHKKIALFTDDIRTPQYIAQKLKENGFKNVKIFVGENLSYDEEMIYEFELEELVRFNKKFELNVVVVACGNM